VNNHHSSANQDILRKLVDREVLLCVSSVVTAFSELVNSGGRSDYVDEDLLNDSFSVVGSDQYREVAEYNCYKVVQHRDTYSWYEEDDFETEPFKGIPVGADVFEREGSWAVFNAGDNPEDDEPTTFWSPTRELAIAQAWEDIWENDWFYTEEEAWEDCCNSNRLDPDPAEVYEHWVVNSWFASKLQDHGEKVIELCGLDVWCRTCTGQAILLDPVIGAIASQMEILEGQRYDWSTNECVPT